MAGFPWLPLGYDLGEIKSGRLISQGNGYQIISDATGERAILLLKAADLPRSGALDRFKQEIGRDVSLGREAFLLGVFPLEEAPVRIVDMAERSIPIESGEMMQLTNSLLIHCQANNELNWSTSLFLPEQGFSIPTEANDDTGDRLATAVSVMTGGVRDPRLSVKQIRHLNSWLTEDDISTMFSALKRDDDDDEKEVASNEVRAAPLSELVPFYLAGQPSFTKMVNEYVIDQIRDKDRYRAMGVRMPNAILLAGPKGAGKTFAVKKLAAHLNWPVFEVGLGDLGSPYIHQTAKNLKSLFDAAARKNGALIVLNEIDAMTGNRGANSQDSKIEEVNEMLRLVETAGERNILVVGTTNRVDGIDEAFLRKGRFDLQIEVAYPGVEQVREIIESLLTQRPHLPGLNLDTLVTKLSGKPVSDIEWVVNEAARMAVKGRKDAIDDICLFGALSLLR